MINPNEKLEIIATENLPQFRWNIYKYHNYDFYITTGGFKEMCVMKYDGRFSLHPFRVVIQ